MSKKKRPARRAGPTAKAVNSARSMAVMRRTMAAVPKPAEVAAKKAGEISSVFLVAVYMGWKPPPDAYPIDLLAFEDFITKYRRLLDDAKIKDLRKTLERGGNIQLGIVGADSRWGPRTVYGVIKGGRAAGDYARALALLNKSLVPVP